MSTIDERSTMTTTIDPEAVAEMLGVETGELQEIMQRSAADAFEAIAATIRHWPDLDTEAIVRDRIEGALNLLAAAQTLFNVDLAEAS